MQGATSKLPDDVLTMGRLSLPLVLPQQSGQSCLSGAKFIGEDFL